MCVLSASQPQPGLTSRLKKVDQSLKQCPVCGTCVSADEARGQIELSEARGLGHRAIIVSRVFPQSSHITHGSSHYGHPSQDISGPSPDTDQREDRSSQTWQRGIGVTQGETKGGSRIKGE